MAHSLGGVWRKQVDSCVLPLKRAEPPTLYRFYNLSQRWSQRRTLPVTSDLPLLISQIAQRLSTSSPARLYPKEQGARSRRWRLSLPVRGRFANRPKRRMSSMTQAVLEIVMKISASGRVSSFRTESKFRAKEPDGKKSCKEAAPQ